MSELTELTELKHGARAMWASGNYDAVAELIWDVGARIVERVGVAPGDDVLDVACGTGNAAIRAAAAGGRVVGVDLTPEMFEAGRRRATAAGVDIEWVEGDVEALPFDGDSFDVVVSTFGCMFAPRHDVTAQELARVLRPGGRLAICAFTAEGAAGDFFGTLGGYLPLPPLASPPLLWGSEEHVRGLFAGTAVELTFERAQVVEHYGSVENALEIYTTTFGPVLVARSLAEPDGRGDALHEDLRLMFERNLLPDEAAVSFEYLVVLGSKPR